jgi:ABC-type polysaccharide/polyol phosphate transport system ATPase subunit
MSSPANNHATEELRTGEPAIQLSGVGKCFLSYRKRVPLISIFKEKILGRGPGKDVFWALRDVGIEIERGEKVGLIGNNGAGKTTLLKLLAGLYRPSHGELQVRGKVTLLSGLGLGMLDELTLEQNLFLYGAIYGMDREVVEKNLYAIMEWAELQEFLGAKLKTLSKGMKTRLAFSATRFIEADVYLLDEALSAGDKSFRAKTIEVFKSYRESPSTFVFSTHNMDFVKGFCSRVLWLHKGSVRAFGETEDVLERYKDFTGDSSERQEPHSPAAR